MSLPRPSLFAHDVLLPSGWAEDVVMMWDERGLLVQVEHDAANKAEAPVAAGPVIPGMPNLHSHAFQRAFAGLAEHRSTVAGSASEDSFWTWRTLMYRFAARLSPEQMEAVATWLYIEMLEAGYTSVCEFQYLHHDVDGRAYADDAEMSLALLRAARSAGIGLTLLPVLYQTNGFGGAAPGEGQRRFIRSNASMLRLLERLQGDCARQGARLGVAPHSLRAVTHASLLDIVAHVHGVDAHAPVHIHIAEQVKEVDDCVAWSGQRPVAWLLSHAPVDERWCLVHATHMDASEIAAAARSRAVAGLCPTTEANLGDGVFAFPAWATAGGRWGIGSDSHVCVNAAEELMWLEYGQRLISGRRNVAAMSRSHCETSPSTETARETATESETATAMTLAAVQGGARASARQIAGLAVGQQADFVVLDGQHVALQGLPAAAMLSALVFASHRTSAVRDVVVAGRYNVTEGRHPLAESAAAAFARSRSQLLAER